MMIARSTLAGNRGRPQTEPPRVLLALTAHEARLLERSTVLFAAAIAPYARDANGVASPLQSARRKLGRAMRLAAGPAPDEHALTAANSKPTRARAARPRARRPVGSRLP